MASFARPLTPEDEEVLGTIDVAYAEALGVDPIVSRASISFYTRSGHAFVAMTEGKESGFVLAHAVWNGARPVVQVSRLAVLEESNTEAREALLEAVTKSAYDAAVYDIYVYAPSSDKRAAEALKLKEYKSVPITVWQRILGSRGQGGKS